MYISAESIKKPKIPHNLFGQSARLAKVFGIFKKKFHLVSVVRVQDEITISCFAKIRGFPQNTLD